MVPEHDRPTMGGAPYAPTQSGWKRLFQYAWSLVLAHCLNVEAIDAGVAAYFAFWAVITAISAGSYLAAGIYLLIAGYWIVLSVLSFLHARESLQKLFGEPKDPMPPLPPARPRHMHSRYLTPQPQRPRSRTRRRSRAIRRWFGLE